MGCPPVARCISSAVFRPVMRIRSIAMERRTLSSRLREFSRAINDFWKFSAELESIRKGTESAHPVTKRKRTAEQNAALTFKVHLTFQLTGARSWRGSCLLSIIDPARTVTGNWHRMPGGQCNDLSGCSSRSRQDSLLSHDPICSQLGNNFRRFLRARCYKRLFCTICPLVQENKRPRTRHRVARYTKQRISSEQICQEV